MAAAETVAELGNDPNWTFVVNGLDPRLERVHETLLTLADGRLGTRGTPLFDHADTAPGVLFSGVYVRDGPATELAACPDWTRLALAPASRP
jgi:kojibiose phosphorylase